MPAYVLADVEILDADAIGTYLHLAAMSIERYGGHQVVQGNHHVAVIEGDRPAGRRLAIVEFPDIERARQWYESPDYAAALAVSRTALRRVLLFIDTDRTVP